MAIKRGSHGDEQYVRDNWDGTLRKISKLPLVRDARALYRYMLDSNVPWYHKSVAVGALAYLVWPLDAIPDFTPVIGYLDDAGVILAATTYLAGKLETYYN